MDTLKVEQTVCEIRSSCKHCMQQRQKLTHLASIEIVDQARELMWTGCCKLNVISKKERLLSFQKDNSPPQYCNVLWAHKLFGQKSNIIPTNFGGCDDDTE